jgi:hypothetical protein
MTKPPLADVPIRSADELTHRWATLLDPPIFGARSLWLMWLGTDGLMLPIVVPVDDVPHRFDGRLTSGLLHLHDAVTEEHLAGAGHLAMALCRPGGAAPTDDDLEWAEDLRLHVEDQIDGTWSLHLAAGDRVSSLVAPPAWNWPRA